MQILISSLCHSGIMFLEPWKIVDFLTRRSRCVISLDSNNKLLTKWVISTWYSLRSSITSRTMVKLLQSRLNREIVAEILDGILLIRNQGLF